jgi:Ca-activated chloride channel family protein
MSYLEMKSAVDRPLVPVTNPETELKCLVKIWPSEELRSSDVQTPLSASICLLIDCSTSMLRDEKYQAAIAAAKAIVDTLSPTQKISLVAFQSKVRILLSDLQATPENRDQIKQQIDELRSIMGGSTNMTDGLKEATDTLVKSQGDAKILIMLSDGAADFPETAEQAAQDATKNGLQLFAVGIGADYKADQLLKMVTPSNGTVFDATEVSKITETFTRLIGRIENFVASNVSLSIRFYDFVQAGLSYKASPEQAFIGNMQPDDQRVASLRVGSLEKDKIYSFMFLATVPQCNPGDFKVCDVKLTFDVPHLSITGATIEQTLSVAFTDDTRKAEELNGEVMEVFRRVSITQLAERFVGAYERADNESAAKYMKILIKRYEEIGDTQMANHYLAIQQDFLAGGKITNEMLNASVVASTVVAGGGELPSIVADDF